MRYRPKRCPTMPETCLYFSMSAISSSTFLRRVRFVRGKCSARSWHLKSTVSAGAVLSMALFFGALQPLLSQVIEVRDERGERASERASERANERARKRKHKNRVYERARCLTGNRRRGKKVFKVYYLHVYTVYNCSFPTFCTTNSGKLYRAIIKNQFRKLKFLYIEN